MTVVETGAVSLHTKGTLKATYVSERWKYYVVVSFWDVLFFLRTGFYYSVEDLSITGYCLYHLKSGTSHTFYSFTDESFLTMLKGHTFMTSARRRLSEFKKSFFKIWKDADFKSKRWGVWRHACRCAQYFVLYVILYEYN